MRYKNPNSVLVVIYCPLEQSFLLLERNDWQGFWQSVTGTIEDGEEPRASAIREVREETGFDIANNKAELIDAKRSVSLNIFPQFRYKYAPEVTQCTEHWFYLLVKQSFTPLLTEHRQFRWVDASCGEKLCISPSNKEALALLATTYDKEQINSKAEV